MRGLLARLAAAALVAAAALAVPSSAAQAAACGDGTGVTVVVDYASLGGGVGQACVGTGTARQQFESAGYRLEDVQTQPGLVCRVAGAPADVSCQDSPPAGAYWALWTSDGKSGRWSYATRGVDSLRVPAGGTVAFVWDDVAGDRPPTVTPSVYAAAPTATPTPTAPTTAPAPTKQPTAKPSRQPSRTPSVQPSRTPSASPTAPTASADPTPSVDPTPTRSAPTASETKISHLTTSPSDTPSAGAVDEPVISPSAQQSEPDQGVPAWLALVLVGLVLLTAIALAVQRRRTSRTP